MHRQATINNDRKDNVAKMRRHSKGDPQLLESLKQSLSATSSFMSTYFSFVSL